RAGRRGRQGLGAPARRRHEYRQLRGPATDREDCVHRRDRHRSIREWQDGRALGSRRPAGHDAGARPDALAGSQNLTIAVNPRYYGLLTILTYAALFWLGVQGLRGPGDGRTLLRVLMAAGYVVAAIAIVQSVSDSLQQGVFVPAAGTLGQKNVLGAFLALLCPL